MAEFIMIMKGSGEAGEWPPYIERLVASGLFRGGSAFGNGRCVTSTAAASECVATGYMRFEATSIDAIQSLLPGNPVLEAGGEVEIHELVAT